MRKQRIFPILAATLALIFLSRHSFAHEGDYDEYVREVLEDERRSYGEQYYEDPYRDPEDLRIEQEAARKAEEVMRRQEEKQAEAEQHEQIRLKRQADFEAKLQKMSADQKKHVMKQKRKDSRLVKKILKASSDEKYYSVLGLTNIEFRVGPFQVLGKAFGPWTFFQLAPKHIKGAYRSKSKATHPDKNNDDRATAAFIAVEEAATILSNEVSKAEYDERMRLACSEKWRRFVAAINFIASAVKKYSQKLWWVFRRLVGPFAYPIVVLTALIV